MKRESGLPSRGNIPVIIKDCSYINSLSIVHIFHGNSLCRSDEKSLAANEIMRDGEMRSSASCFLLLYSILSLSLSHPVLPVRGNAIRTASWESARFECHVRMDHVGAKTEKTISGIGTLPPPFSTASSHHQTWNLALVDDQLVFLLSEWKDGGDTETPFLFSFCEFTIDVA